MLKFLKNSHEILGMNARNLEYIQPNNLRNGFRIADNKILTKKVLERHHIPTPKIFGIIQGRKMIADFKWIELPASFVIKPNRGFGGGGIVVIFGKRKDNLWIGTQGVMGIPDITNHLHNILDGSFSLYNTPDIAFFEERIKIHKDLKPYAIQGIPDIRVIVYNRIPVMAMLRLPTKASGGKANLHQGGVGVGIDVARGVTTNAVSRDKTIDRHPDTKLKLSGIKIPYWKDILELAIRTQEATALGYIGADIAIDKEKGPVILEVNARPGLAIQIANRSPLKERLERVKGLKVKTLERGVRIAKELFGGEIEQEVEEITGRPVIGIFEKAAISNLGETQKKEIDVKIDTGAFLSSLDETTAYELGYRDALDAFERYRGQMLKQCGGDEKKYIEIIRGNEKKEKLEAAKFHPDLDGLEVILASNGIAVRPTIKIILTLAEKQFITRITIANRKPLKYQMIIGRKDLRSFLIDPAKEPHKKLSTKDV